MLWSPINCLLFKFYLVSFFVNAAKNENLTVCKSRAEHFCLWQAGTSNKLVALSPAWDQTNQLYEDILHSAALCCMVPVDGLRAGPVALVWACWGMTRQCSGSMNGQKQTTNQASDKESVCVSTANSFTWNTKDVQGYFLKLQHKKRAVKRRHNSTPAAAHCYHGAN